MFTSAGNKKLVEVFQKERPVMHLDSSLKLGTFLTPARPSEISERNWSTNAEVIFDIPFMMLSQADSMNKNPGSPLDSIS